MKPTIDGCVNLAWFDHNGVAHNATSVLEAETQDQEGRWSWPSRT